MNKNEDDKIIWGGQLKPVEPHTKPITPGVSWKIRHGDKGDDLHMPIGARCWIVDAPDHSAFAYVIARMNSENEDSRDLLLKANIIGRAMDTLLERDALMEMSRKMAADQSRIAAQLETYDNANRQLHEDLEGTQAERDTLKDLTKQLLEALETARLQLDPGVVPFIAGKKINDAIVAAGGESWPDL